DVLDSGRQVKGPSPKGPHTESPRRQFTHYGAARVSRGAEYHMKSIHWVDPPSVGTWVHVSLRAEGGGVSGFDDISHRDGEAGQEGRLDGVGIRVGAVHGVARRGPRVHFDGAPIHVDDPVLFYAVASVQTAFGGGVPVSRRRRHDLDDEVGRPLDTLLNDVAVIVED